MKEEFWALNKLLLVVFSSALILVLGDSVSEAFAVTVESNGSGGGLWHVGSSWSGGVIPNISDDVIIKDGDSITRQLIYTHNGDITIENGAELIVAAPFGTFFTTGQVTNNGDITIQGSGSITARWLLTGGSLTNNNLITINGGTGSSSGQLSVGVNAQMANNGIININGNNGQDSGSLSNSGPFVNSDTITVNSGAGNIAGNLRVFASYTNECEGTITLNAGTFFDINAVFNNFGTLNNQATTINPQLIIDRSGECPSPQPVGGELIPLDTTLCLVAVTQYTAAWMIPVIVSGIGIAIVVARKF